MALLFEQPAETQREKIIAELERRLETIRDPATGKKTLVERGYAGVDIDKLPKIIIFEDEETIVESKRGLYQKTLPLWIEFFRNVNEPRQIYIQGNRMFAEVRRAVELDERFFENATPTNCPSLSSQGQGLVNSYRQTRNAIYELDKKRVLAIFWYEFVYWECRTGVANPSCNG